MMEAPCANLVERDTPECAVGRRIPVDCHRACAYYAHGLTDQERRRALAWSQILRRIDDDGDAN